MPTSYLPPFELARIDASNVRITMDSTTVGAYNMTAGGTFITNKTSDGNGVIAAASYSVDPGTVIEFRSGTYPLTAQFTTAATQSKAYLIGNPSTYILQNLYTTTAPSLEVDLFAFDIDNPEAVPVFLGTGKKGQSIAIPYTSTVEKNLRIRPIARDLKTKSIARPSFSTSNYSDVNVPAGSGGLTIGDTLTGGTSARLLKSGATLGESATIGTDEYVKWNGSNFVGGTPTTGATTPLFEFAGARTNLTSDDDIWTYYLPAGTLATNGDWVEITFTSHFAANTNDKSVTLTFGSYSLGTAGPSPYNSTNVTFIITLIRKSATTAESTYVFTVNGVTIGTDHTVLTGLNYSSDIAMSIHATSDAANDVTLYSVLGKKIAAPTLTVPTTNLWAYFEGNSFSDAEEGIYTDGDTIGTDWVDRSGNSRTATRTGSPVYKRAIINGQDVVRFGGSTYFTLPSMASFTAGEIFIVGTVTDITTNAGWGVFGNSGSASHYPYNTGGASQIYDDFGSTVRKGVLTSLLTISNTAHVYNAWSASADWSLYQNGCLVSHTGTNTVGFNSAPKIGTNNTFGLKGDIAGVYIFNAKLSAANRAKMYAYIANKYAL